VLLERVVLQPHHASGTHDTRTAMGRLTLDNVTAYFAGRPLLTQV
jgi:lactate dehydrogenase-like 2-hydroxyacid dehydrogenase